MFQISISILLPVLGLLAGSMALLVWKLFQSDKDIPTLFYQDGPLSRHILERAPSLTRPFRPPRWAKNRHIQTILPSFLPKVGAKFRREHLSLKDGGMLAIDWWDPDGTSALGQRSPLLLALPGLTGDASGLAALCKWGLQQGFRAAVFNKRGHGGCALTTPKMQSFGDPADLRQVIVTLHGRFPDAALTAVGVSAGSGLLTSYLGEYGPDSLIAGAVCISPGYDAGALFTHCVKQPYNYLLLQSLKRLLSKHQKILGQAIDVQAAMSSSNIAQFEERLYCRIYGYSNMETYWSKNNPLRNIDNVCPPVLCINSFDDPICVKKEIPIKLFTKHPTCMLLATQRGGHCGFLEHPYLENWSDKVAIEYLQAILEYKDK